MSTRICLIFLTWILLALPLPLSAWSKLTTDLNISCVQKQLELVCEYMTPDGGKLQSIEASANKQTLPIKQTNFSVGKDNTVAILFVVDTSDPARQKAVEKNSIHIQALLDNLKPGTEVGLASFNKTLQIEAPLGESTFLIKKQLQTLKAVGKTTELYRNVIEALQYLDKQQASRKALFLMSDGQAEDKAYFHSDVIKVAKDAGIIINTIGYPRSISLSVALQTLRRLSEETGGNFTETSNSYELPVTYSSKAFDNIYSGGSLSIDLQDLQQANKLSRIKFEYTGKQGKNALYIPIQIGTQPAEAAVTTATTATASITKPEVENAPVSVITRQVESQPVNLWLWYGIPAAFIIIIIFILITLFLLWQRPASSSSASATNYEFKPYAYLIDQNEDNKRYPITRTIWRIGRGKDNELALEDSSLSRRHAEIHRNINGGFDIIDMNSMNGVYINGEKIGKALLQEEDVIEIGDILLKFSQFAPEYSEEESTVMQKTKTPEVSIS